ncbi:reverse transcriptase family protein [Curtobacterium sp. ISL-83]|uniref:reverse transcriptase family protein n=1 Tax=Curtobacterium sp. ISL-83 TaxID=2819145 RepID=UPI001BE75549|nr:reverse transcriptase family protein [Curtobacterium sp. ISL-83]MBT2501038.1 RNA-directed DNA polymerase [Curtobacterium sp. ISL-83]
MGFPGEADGVRGASSSPGQPRGTQEQLTHPPREARRAPRALPHGSTDQSPGNPGPLAEVAQALADAFLTADDWSRPALTAVGYDAIGVERAIVGLAVGAALDAYPRAPSDAPRQLARVLAAAPRLQSAYAARDPRVRPVRILARPVGAVRAGRSVDSPLLVDTVPELARALDLTVGHLLWLADPGGWNRRPDASSALHHYGYAWIPRGGRTPRLIEKPKPLLRRTQRLLLDGLLGALPVHDAAHGFVAGRSAVTGAAEHVGRQVVVTVDLTAFFASVTAGSVFGVFRTAGFAEPVARVLTGLCTARVPVHALRTMPDGGSVEHRFALRQALRLPHLPQGAPSSPVLANLSLRHLDARLAGLAAASGATYTRYADDLTFSGDDHFAGSVDGFLRAVGRIVVEQGHTINQAKTRVRRRGRRQSVTGIVVNERVAPGRAEHDRLKAILHNCAVHGPQGQNRAGHPDFRAHLEGRITWMMQLNPERGARLRAVFERIEWG